jgi:hypothetical protein
MPLLIEGQKIERRIFMPSKSEKQRKLFGWLYSKVKKGEKVPRPYTKLTKIQIRDMAKKEK